MKALEKQIADQEKKSKPDTVQLGKLYRDRVNLRKEISDIAAQL